MLSRMNTSSEVSLLPTGLGNHYLSSSRHLIPHGRRKLPYNHSVSSASDCGLGDPNAPEANMSFREHQEYFGPDVLVIIGLVLSCIGAILTLISFYCEFKHPAIQATMAGIGPSLVGIGMLFCILRIFFCTFCISRTCCECIADGLRFMVIRCPCFKYFRKPKKQIHPLHVKDTNSRTIITQKPTANGQTASKALESMGDKRKNGSIPRSNNNNTIPNGQSMEMTALRMDPIHETDERKTLTPDVTETQTLSEDSTEERRKEVDDILKDEIDLLDEIKSEQTSPRSNISLNHNINELVLKTSQRY